MTVREVRVPDLGGSENVPVIAVLVKPGDVVQPEDPLFTLESEKATMDVPAPFAGIIDSLNVAVGSKVSTGSLVATMTEVDAAPVAASASAVATTPSPIMLSPRSGSTAESAAEAATSSPAGGAAAAAEPVADLHLPLVVLGAGPGGYTAAFRAADLGLTVGLVERWPTLGGVCLNVGCIPSKALLHAAKVIEEAHDMAELGVKFAPPAIDAVKLKGWKDRVVGKLTTGLAGLAKQRKVTVLRGTGTFLSPHRLAVVAEDGTRQVVGFDQCIIAAGSEPVKLPDLPADPRILDSTSALDLPRIAGRLLVIGGGIIGLEMACVYDALGARVSVVELGPGLMPGADRDLVRPLEKRLKARYEALLTGTKVVSIEALPEGLRVVFEGKGAPEPQVYDQVLVAVGRVPNGKRLDAAAAGVAVDARGFIAVDRQMRTNVTHIFAIGDVVGQPMLAHKATHEGKLAAEVVAGQQRAFDARVIPSVAYTDPEVAWVGLTETQAGEQGIKVEKGVFPWAASGRALALNRDEGFTKLLFDVDTRRIVGAGIVGPSAGELIGEVALAIEMGADAEDIGATIHPHPTLTETVAFAAEAFEGTLTDLYLPRRK
ncbi:MAG: dihydrolipoyl dehydrogenase [Gammaproteobacteria bacterium]